MILILSSAQLSCWKAPRSDVPLKHVAQGLRGQQGMEETGQALALRPVWGRGKGEAAGREADGV